MPINHKYLSHYNVLNKMLGNCSNYTVDDEKTGISTYHIDLQGFIVHITARKVHTIWDGFEPTFEYHILEVVYEGI